MHLLFITEWAKEQLPYPTMCEDGQETGYGKRTVVYGVNGWCSVIKEPDEAEDCTSLERLVFHHRLEKNINGVFTYAPMHRHPLKPW